MFKPVHRAQVDEKTVSRIVRLIDFLAKITPPNEHPTLQNFIQAFQSRYEEAEVPLAVALTGSWDWVIRFHRVAATSIL